MDTRFWGPSGWRLLHIVTFGYMPRKQKSKMREFLGSLPYVLPCKFCRSSLITYYEELPFEKELESAKSLSKWLWKIHGKVNEKLREQGQTIPPDPSFAEVSAIYTERLASMNAQSYGCTKTGIPGWEFLFSVAENHPTEPVLSTPIPHAPPLDSEMSESELCKWNYIEGEKRFEKLCIFWNTLPYVLPLQQWRDMWLSVTKSAKCPRKRKDAIKELWRIRSALEKERKHLQNGSFRKLCKTLRKHRSACSKSRNSRTCRKIRHPKKDM